MSEKPAKTKSKSKPSASKSKETTKTKAKSTKKTTAKVKTPKKTSKTAKKTSKAKKPTAQPAKKTTKKRKTETKAEARPKPSRRLPLEKPVKGILMNYQRGTVTQREKYGLIQLEGITSLAQAAPYIGRSVILHFGPNKTNQGRIISAHGRRGVLRVRFRRSLAADAIAQEVLVY